MSGNKRLTATVPEEHGECLERATDDRFDSRPHAERKAVEEGLRRWGYLEEPDQPHKQLLWVVNRVGLGLGFVGLAALGIGVFGPRISSLVGFALTLGGFVLLLVEAALDRQTESMMETIA